MDFNKKTPTNTITRDVKYLAEPTGNIYETVVLLSKRANQISLAEKKELAQILSRSIPTEYDILDAEYLELEVSHGRKHGVRSTVGRGDNSEAILSFRFARRPGA